MPRTLSIHKEAEEEGESTEGNAQLLLQPRPGPAAPSAGSAVVLQPLAQPSGEPQCIAVWNTEFVLGCITRRGAGDASGAAT